MSEKESESFSVSLWKCKQEAITQYWLNSAKILRIMLFYLEFQCPKYSQIILTLINLASLNVQLYKLE